MHNYDSFDWKDIGKLGALAEELSDAESERRRLLKDLEPEDDEIDEAEP